VRRQLVRAMWPLLYRTAGMYRRTLLRAPRLLAITGSFGKTTTMRTTAAALGMPHPPREGWSYGSHLAHCLLLVMPWERRYVFELGMKLRGEIGQYAWMLKPDVAIITGIGSEHHREIGALEDIRNEKWQAIRQMTLENAAVLNGDDPAVRWMASQTRARVILYGFGEENQVRASDYHPDGLQGSRFLVHIDGATHEVSTRLLGRHMSYAVLAALAAAYAEDIDLEQAIERISRVAPTRKRMEPVWLPSGACLICDDHKASLETMEPAFRFLGELRNARRILVIGDMEDFPGKWRPTYRRMGALIAESADIVLIIGLNQQAYASGAAAAGMPRANIIKCGGSVRLAFEWLRDNLHDGDIVLIKARFKQELDRIAIALQGRPVACWVENCPCRFLTCQECPMLERGWSNGAVVC
jgi:UDP-N-acetylmuramoyl-tripeptide--D-alanyl-D-alanine ligase